MLVTRSEATSPVMGAASALMPGSDAYLAKLHADIERMLDYARDSGRALEGDLPRRVAAVRAARNLEELIRVHGVLCDVVRPATPATLAATEHTAAPWYFFRISGVPVFNRLLWATLIALVVHVASASWQQRQREGQPISRSALGGLAAHRASEPGEAAP